MKTPSTRTCKTRLNFGSQKHAKKKTKMTLKSGLRKITFWGFCSYSFWKCLEAAPRPSKITKSQQTYHTNPIVVLWHVASFHEELAPIPSCFSTLFRVSSVARVNKYEHAVPKIGEHSVMCFNNFEGAERAEFKTEITAPLFRQCSLLSSVWQWYAMISALNSIISWHILW